MTLKRPKKNSYTTDNWEEFRARNLKAMFDSRKIWGKMQGKENTKEK